MGGMMSMTKTTTPPLPTIHGVAGHKMKLQRSASEPTKNSRPSRVPEEARPSPREETRIYGCGLLIKDTHINWQKSSVFGSLAFITTAWCPLHHPFQISHRRRRSSSRLWLWIRLPAAVFMAMNLYSSQAAVGLSLRLLGSSSLFFHCPFIAAQSSVLGASFRSAGGDYLDPSASPTRMMVVWPV